MFQDDRTETSAIQEKVQQLEKILPKFKIEEKLKQLMRLFRRSFKSKYTHVHGKKSNKWLGKKQRHCTKEFFTSILKIDEITSDFYDRHEIYFYSLLHTSLPRPGSNDVNECCNFSSNSAVSKVKELYKHAFEQNSSKQKLTKLFKI